MVPGLRDISDPKEYSAALSKLADSMRRTEASRQQLMWQRKVLAAQEEVSLIVVWGKILIIGVRFLTSRFCTLVCCLSRNSRGCSNINRAVSKCSCLSTSRTC